MKKKVLIFLGMFFIAIIAFVNVNIGFTKSESSELGINAMCKANEAQAECNYPCEPIYSSCCWAPYNAVIWTN